MYYFQEFSFMRKKLLRKLKMNLRKRYWYIGILIEKNFLLT